MTTPAQTPESSRLKRTAKGGALVTVGLIAGLAASQVEQVGNLLRDLRGNNMTPEAPANPQGKAPAAPGSPDAPNPHREEATRLLSQMHQYLNPQSVTAAHCDSEIERAIADANNPQKTANVEHWQQVRSFAELDRNLQRIVEAMIQPGANVEALVAEADQLLNPHRLTAEGIRAAQAECAARGDLQADTMARQWGVHARLLTLLEGVNTLARNVRTGRR